MTPNTNFIVNENVTRKEIWFIGEEDFDSFIAAGGERAIYIVEEPLPEIASNPAVVGAPTLLPPIEAITAELEGDYSTAEVIYNEYLKTPEVDIFISVIIAAVLQNISLALIFGQNERNFWFPKVFLNHLFNMYGISVGTDGMTMGIDGEVMPFIANQAIPFDFAKIYNMGIIDYQTFMSNHPNMPIHPSCLTKMIQEIRPALGNNAGEAEYYNYFEFVRQNWMKYKKPLITAVEAL